MIEFREELKKLLNIHSMENGCDTPDHILADYLQACLEAFDMAVIKREMWYGRSHKDNSRIVTRSHLYT